MPHLSQWVAVNFILPKASEILMPDLPCQKTNLWTVTSFYSPSKAKPTNFTTCYRGVLRVPKESEPFVPGTGKWSQRKNLIELFDLEKNLSETRDLAAQHPKAVCKLTDKYNAWLDEMADPVSKQVKSWYSNSCSPARKMSKEEKKAAWAKKAARIKAREAKRIRQTPESSD